MNNERRIFMDLIKNFYDKNNDNIENLILEYSEFLFNSKDKTNYEQILSYSGGNRKIISPALIKNKIKIIENLRILEFYDAKIDFANYIDPLNSATEKLVDIMSKNIKMANKTLKIFMTGRPGTGKTSYIKFLSKKTFLPLYYLKASKIISSFLGDTHKNIDLLKEDINEIGSKGIIMIDEIDSILGKRDNSNNDEYRKMIGSFNLMLDSIDHSTIIIAITNNKNFIDSAIIRRFNIEIELNEIDAEYFKKIILKKARQNDIDLDLSVLNKIIKYYSENNKFETQMNYSFIDNLINNNLFLGKNIYKNLILFFENEEIDIENILLRMNLNKTQISKILDKDRRTVKIDSINIKGVE